MTKNNLDLLDEESAMQALEIVGELAKRNGIDWAVVGGVAMSLYGSDRLTRDIDIIASKRLPMPKEKSPDNCGKAANVFWHRPTKKLWRLIGLFATTNSKRYFWKR